MPKINRGLSGSYVDFKQGARLHIFFAIGVELAPVFVTNDLC